MCEAHRGRTHYSGRVCVLIPRAFLVVELPTAVHVETGDLMGPEMAQLCLPMEADTFPSEDLEDDSACASVIDTAEAAARLDTVAAAAAAKLSQTLLQISSVRFSLRPKNPLQIY